MSLPSTTLYNCSDIKLYKEKVFSSIRGRFAAKYIRPNKKLANKILNDEEILGFHFYNHISEKLGIIPLTKENPIGMIARKFCPVVALQSNYMFT
ncbi:hypothetical protein Avbf_05554 [Armadillidium vulgare]|nr:hypothetical protein Avbf_05554 [Armadillidium vulgare]